MDTASGPALVLLAAEPREFDGLLKRVASSRCEWRGAAFARRITLNAADAILIANGPGPRLVNQALQHRVGAGALISTGFCGALDPALRIGDIVLTGEVVQTAHRPCVKGEIVSMDKVVVTATEKGELRRSTGAAAVDMESGAVQAKAREWNIPFGAVRVVSDTAAHDLPLDFNEYYDSQGRFSRGRIALAALRRPFRAIPGLARLDRQCRQAAESLGEFLANCEF